MRIRIHQFIDVELAYGSAIYTLLDEERTPLNILHESSDRYASLHGVFQTVEDVLKHYEESARAGTAPRA